MKKTIAFGETMLRLSPPGYQRFEQATEFEIIWGGADSNVLALLATLGIPVEYVTRLPDNPIGDSCRNFFRQNGIGVQHILRGGDRMGVYFYEKGAGPRPGLVIYDRANSAMAEIAPGMVDWDAVFTEADWFHLTGITPAISESAAAVCLEAVQAARKHNLTISTDFNYRSKLWKWGKTPAEVMPALIEHADIALLSVEDIAMIFDIHPPQDAENPYKAVCDALAKRCPQLQAITCSTRKIISANHNELGGMLWYEGEFFTSRVYDVQDIVDRVGAGDSFMGGLIYGLRNYISKQDALNFAVASTCLKHTVLGDINYTNLQEIEQLMHGEGTGRVSR